MLAAYLRSLRAIVRSQFTQKAARGGRLGVIELLENSPIIRVLPWALPAAGLSGKLAALTRAYLSYDRLC